MNRRELLALSAAATSVYAAPDPLAGYTDRIFERANELRAARSAPALIWSDALAACALEQSRRKAQLRFPGHDDPERGDVGSRLSAAGVPWNACGENLFMERGYEDPVNFAIVSWWYSLGHQKNMVNPDYTHTGIGITRASDGAYFIAQIFVRPPDVQRPAPSLRARRR